MTPSDKPELRPAGIGDEPPGADDAELPENAAAGPRASEDVPPGGTPEQPLAQRRFTPRRFVPRRRSVRVATAAVTGLAVLAGTADLVLAHTARERIAHAASCQLAPAGRVSADLSGSLAGLRLLTGRVGSVHIQADDVRRDGLDLTVAADLRQVTTKGTMSGGTATATLSYDELGKRLNRNGAGLRPESDGHGGLVLTGTLVGIPLPVTVHTGITTGADSITITPTDVDVLGRTIPVPQMTSGKSGSALADKLAPRTVKAPDLPAGVRLTGARTGVDGLGLTLSLPASVSSGGGGGCAG